MKKLIISSILLLTLIIPAGLAKSQTYLVTKDYTQNIINEDVQRQIDKLNSIIRSLELRIIFLERK